MAKAVGVNIQGRIEWHAPGVFDDYATMCGIDALDEDQGVYGTVEAPPGQKIECGVCRSIWASTIALRLRASDFITK